MNRTMQYIVKKQHFNRGFTLVELNLALIFVAILTLGVAMTVINISKIYQRGVTVKTVNQVGRETMDQLRRDIVASKKPIKFISSANNGRLCLGTVSYLYNTAAGINANNPALIKNTASKVVHFVRIEDTSQEWCDTSPLKTTITSAYTELLSTDTVTLVVYAMDAQRLTPTSADSSEVLTQVSMMLGTNEAGTVNAANECKPPTDNQANFDYCAVREFNTVVRSSGAE